MWFGIPYLFQYRFSPACIRQPSQGGGISPIIEGRTQVKQWLVNYANSIYFRSEVTPDYGNPVDKAFTAKVIAEQDDAPGQIHSETGQHRFRVQAKNDRVSIDILNDLPFPAWLVSATWEGEYTSRSRRV